MFNKIAGKIFGMNNEKGFSLLELIVVIIIIGVLSLVAVENFSGSVEISRQNETIAEMEELKKALIGDSDLIEDGIRTDFGFIGDTGSIPSNALFQGDILRVSVIGGWRGPYMSVDFQSDDYLKDAWGELYVLDPSAMTIYSPGLDRTIVLGNTSSQMLLNQVRIIITDRQGYTPKTADLGNIQVSLTLRNGTTLPLQPVGSGGLCTISSVPVGIHDLTVTHTVLGETVPKRVVVYPGVTAGPIEIKFTALP
ncbi:prepilin-type N-terminal cleavage/methylation domain-containing protein [candidate division KSB1 bacterium]